ncbi:MAG: hypothetical protein C5B50_22755 [Verrucomicrobia bacterium]|nr:MAG: hypothetical protein C5B50_22755 [Verrucomicrobiota bacterium]
MVRGQWSCGLVVPWSVVLWSCSPVIVCYVLSNGLTPQFPGIGYAGNMLYKVTQQKQLMETRSADEIAESTEKLLEDLKAVVRDGEDLLRAGAHNLSERGQAARERLAAALEIAKDTQRRLQERAVAGAQAADRVVREHPYQSIGVAFGIGLLVGVLVNRR